MTVQDVLFTFLGLITAAGAVRAVTTCQIVHAALWLTLCLAALSGCYLVLGAELVALVQLLVYVGAVVVLVLFAVMLTHSPIGKSGDYDVPVAGRIAAFVVAAATGGLLFAAFTAAFGTRGVHLDAGSNIDLAGSLFGRFTWPFEVLSLVLLAVLVGALAMVGQRPRSASAGATRPARLSLRAQPAAADAKSRSVGSETTEPTAKPESAQPEAPETEPAKPETRTPATGTPDSETLEAKTFETESATPESEMATTYAAPETPEEKKGGED